MTVCPIALAAGCKKCPAFSFCPLKGVLGDHKAEGDAPAKGEEDASDGARPKR